MTLDEMKEELLNENSTNTMEEIYDTLLQVGKDLQDDVEFRHRGEHSDQISQVQACKLEEEGYTVLYNGHTELYTISGW